MRRADTKHSQQIYKSMLSAMRAAKNAVGSKVGVVNPTIGERFDAHVTIKESMLGLAPCEDGWRWTFSYGPDDAVPYRPWDDAKPGEIPATAPSGKYLVSSLHNHACS